jgi:hypothetical protein
LGGVRIAIAPKSALTLAIISPIALSALIPVLPLRTLLHSGPFKHIPSYFQFRDIMEGGEESIVKLLKEKPTLICLQPHGIFSFVSLCCAVKWSQSWWDPATTPTAVASSILGFPLLKHIIGILGIMSASAGPLVEALQSEENRGVILYPGGTSELFLAHPERERLFVLQRKGL